MPLTPTDSGPKIASLASVRGTIIRHLFWLAALTLALWAVFPGFRNLTALFLHKQDLALVGLQVAILFSVLFWNSQRKEPILLSWRMVIALALGVTLLCYLGHLYVLSGHALSRDEQMAIFDAWIYSRGELAQSLPVAWQSHTNSLNTFFMLLGDAPQAWVSAYLPFNSLLRVLIGWFADPALTGPIMTGLGALAIYQCARSLWPDHRETASLGVLFYLGSGQIWLTGMTAYAMPAHLTLNLIWLALFLRRGVVSDSLAILVGFMATGLHQPLFHPLFVFPILCTLLINRQYWRAGYFLLGYALIGLFWLSWPGWIHQLVSAPGLAPVAGTDFLSRLSHVLQAGDGLRWHNMAANLIRFIAWQNIWLFPLIWLGWRSMRKHAFAAALGLSVALPILVMTLILPYQGHGFGYRYLHGTIGSVILLALMGWQRLESHWPTLRPMLIRGFALTACLILPTQLFFAYQLYRPYAELDRQLRGLNADYVIVGASQAPFALDLVINRPDLANRPIRLIGEYLAPDLATKLCQDRRLLTGPAGAANHRVRVALTDPDFLAPISHYFGVKSEPKAGPGFGALTQRLQSAGCTIIPIRQPGGFPAKRATGQP